MSPADESPLHPGFVPMPEMRIANAETLRAISDPTRMRILETMVQRQDPPWSVKELAAALGVPPTRLYHHVEQLLAHDLVRPVERRVVSGIIETRYRVAALSFQLDRRLFAADADEAARHPPRHDGRGLRHRPRRDRGRDAQRGHRSVAGATRTRVLVSRGLARLTPARAAEYRRAPRRARPRSSPRLDDTDPEAPAPGASSSPSIRCLPR